MISTVMASQSSRSERRWSKSGRDDAFSVNGVGIKAPVPLSFSVRETPGYWVG
jgi:hypothetical protein